MAAAALSLCYSDFTRTCSRKHDPFLPRLFLAAAGQKRMLSPRFVVSAVTKGSAKSNKSEETLPSWAKPDSDEPPPWAQDEGKKNPSSQQGFEIPFFVYLLASAVTAIAAIGSAFEYVNEKPVFGILNSDSIFYAPVLGFFVFTGIPSSLPLISLFKHSFGLNLSKLLTRKLRNKTRGTVICRFKFVCGINCKDTDHFLVYLMALIYFLIKMSVYFYEAC